MTNFRWSHLLGGSDQRCSCKITTDERAFLSKAFLSRATGMASNMGTRLMLVAAFACLTSAAYAGQHNPPHPLDRFLFESFAVVIDPNVSVTLNSTVQSTTSQNFLLTITGV